MNLIEFVEIHDESFARKIQGSSVKQAEFKNALVNSKPYFSKTMLGKKVEIRFILKMGCFCLTETTEDTIYVYEVTSFLKEAIKRLIRLGFCFQQD